jgi:hypothetical protein
MITIRIDGRIMAVANDDGTWTCDDPLIQKYLNAVAGKRAVYEKWVYVPDMADAMVFLANTVLPEGSMDIRKRSARSPPGKDTIY